MAREITRSRSSTPPTPPPLNPNVLPESVVPEVSMVEAEDVTGVTFTPEYVSLYLSLRLPLLSSFPPLCPTEKRCPATAIGRMLTSSQVMDAETTLGFGGFKKGGREICESPILLTYISLVHYSRFCLFSHSRSSSNCMETRRRIREMGREGRRR